MTCTACERSKADPINDRHWTAHCLGCKARALAAIGIHSDAVEIGQISPAYRGTLERLFGEQWRLGHAKVSEWHSRIRDAARMVPHTRNQQTPEHTP
jgi:hypothetical protein